MSVEIEIVERRKVAVAFLEAHCGVRYWEDGKVNGEVDEDGSRIPCRQGDDWAPLIEIETGVICNWPLGVTADLHYKVCDDGMYRLLDADGNTIKQISGYVPRIMCPGDDGYGDYVIMEIDGLGRIKDWKVELAAFEKAEK